MPHATFADFLRFYRIRAALTQEELASRTGVSVRAIRDMERGRAQRPQRRTVELLAAGLDMTPEEVQALQHLARSGAGSPRPTPAMSLSGGSSELVGREADLAGLARRADQGGELQVVVVHGPPGIGKTALAVAAGHRLAERFPDGCFFVDMQGLDPLPLDADAVVQGLLTRLGVDNTPADPAHRLNLYRSLLYERTVLLILDNPATETTVRPLLAVSPGSMVLITSRNTLTGLAATARFELDTLRPDQAARLLVMTAGERIAAEPAAVAEIVELCGRIPLALRIAGARLAGSPDWQAADMAHRLAEQRLSTLAGEDTQVRTAFQLSYDVLTERAAKVFRRLSLVYGPDATAELAAVAAGETAAVTQSILDELVDANLLRAGRTPGRYGFHDLIRIFAQECAQQEGLLAGTRQRITEWLLAKALAATGYFQPDGTVDQTDFPDRESADQWLADETANWRGALRATTPEQVLRLATAMHWYSDYRGTGELWHEVFSAGVSAARALGRTSELSTQLNFLCWTLFVPLGRVQDAFEVHHQAMTAAIESGNVVEQAWACYYRSGIEKRCGNLPEAIAYARRAVETFAAAGHPVGEQIATSYLGVVLRQSGDDAGAADMYERAIAQHRATTRTPSTTSDDNLAFHLVRYAESLDALGRVPEALAALSEAGQRCGRHQVHGRVLLLHGRVLARAGDLAGAYEQLAAALDLARNPDVQVQVLVAIAEVCDGLSDPEQARAHRIRALATCTRFDIPELRLHATALSTALGM